ncbi:MAG: glycine--tRNA ligase [Pseudomonadota bacterium]
MSEDKMEKLVSLCKRRGYIFQSSEIYGGINSCYDYGPLGIELKNNLKRYWWESMVHRRDDIEGIDASILMHPKVWKASGHIDGFTDPLIDCKKCKNRFKAEDLKSNEQCPKCGGELTEPRNFNLMFKTFMGPVEEDANVVYLRPETAQGIYVNFLNVLNASRQKLPFGIAQIGKAFRNEITPGNFIFRTREFEQMEMQFFINPKDDEKWFEYWKAQRLEWFKSLGLKEEKLRYNEHGPTELAHYAKAAFDIQYKFPFGWQEVEGIHNRSDFDLTQHMKFSNKKLNYFDEKAKEKYVPYIIETSIGCDRTLLTLLVDAYEEEGERVVLKLHPKLAPYQVAVFPLINKEGMPEAAVKIYDEAKKKFKAFYDTSGAIGRRYRRQDEAGTPFCITIDADTVKDGSVTLRERDSMEQGRFSVEEAFEKISKASTI